MFLSFKTSVTCQNKFQLHDGPHYVRCEAAFVRRNSNFCGTLSMSGANSKACVNMITILKMLAKLVPPGSVKMKVLSNRVYNFCL